MRPHSPLKSINYGIRPFQPNDLPQLLQAIQLLVPGYFAVSVVQDYSAYLEQKREKNFVVVQNGLVIASGDINYVPARVEALISWDLVYPQ